MPGAADRYGCGWTDQGSVAHPVAPGWVLNSIDAAVTDEDVIFGATLAAGIDADTTAVLRPLTIGRFDPAGIESPIDAPMAIYPRFLVSPRGHVHLLWGEPAASDSTRPDDALSMRVHVIRQAAWNDGRWTGPVDLIRDSARIWWRIRGGSVVMSDRGDLHLVVSTTGPSHADVVHTVLKAQGGTRRTRIPVFSEMPYSNVHASGDSAVIAFSAKLQREDPKAGATLYIVRSEDGGRSWSNPVALAHSLPLAATMVTIARTPDRDYHMILGESDLASPWTIRFHHLSASHPTGSWQVRARFDVHWTVQEPQLAADSFGNLHFIFRERGPAGPMIRYARWSGEWTDPDEVFPGARNGALVEHGSRVHLVLAYGTGPESRVAWKAFECLSPGRKHTDSIGRLELQSTPGL